MVGSCGGARVVLSTAVCGLAMACGEREARAEVIAREPVVLTVLESERLSRDEAAARIPRRVRETFDAVDDANIAELQRAFAADGGIGIVHEPFATRTDLPGSRIPGLQVYAAIEAHSQLATRHHVFVLFDPVSGTVSPAPVRIETMAHENDELRFALVDLDVDGSPELAYRHHTRNGTMDNTIAWIYLRIGDDLSLTEVLRHPVWTFDILGDDGQPAVRRRLMRTAPGSTTLVVESWRENPAIHDEREILPEVVIRRDAATGAWERPDRWPVSLDPRWR